MSLDQRRRQKKLEKKAAKRKERLKSLARENPGDVRSRFRQAATAPIVHSLASGAIFDQGIGHVLLTREVAPGQLAVSVFLVDLYCLGVKDAFWNIRSRADVETLVEKISPNDRPIQLKPACARKLVEGAVEYARELGFSPHEDFQMARLLLGNIDAAACPESFTYGKDGKPFYIAGPYESSARRQQIMKQLEVRLGSDGFHFLHDVSPLDLIADESEIAGE